MSILDNVSDRATWMGAASTLILRLQMLETQISIAMIDRPTSSQAIALVQADQQLGIAVTAVQEAAAKIRSIAP